MSKLLQRLQDPSRSGAYRTTGTDAILDAVRGSKLSVVSISLKGDKPAILRSIARALGFPQWFGGNWDALEDCLTDLSWREADGHVLLFDDASPSDDLGILVDVLASSAEFWAARGKSFFAVFVDPQRSLGLADLFRET